MNSLFRSDQNCSSVHYIVGLNKTDDRKDGDRLKLRIYVEDLLVVQAVLYLVCLVRKELMLIEMDTEKNSFGKVYLPEKYYSILDPRRVAEGDSTPGKARRDGRVLKKTLRVSVALRKQRVDINAIW